MRRMLRVLGVILAAGLAVALIHPQLLFSELIFGRGDAFVYFTPLWALRDSALRAGELPLWTSRLFMGAPLLSDPQLGVFYPPNWLTVGLPAPYALKIATWLHLAWALAGAYLLARRQVGLTRPAAWIAAACFGFGGYMTSHADQINQLQGMSWLPWAFLALGYAAHRPLRGIFPLAAVLGLIALTGHTQTLFITGVALGIGALTLSRSDERKASSPESHTSDVTARGATPLPSRKPRSFSSRITHHASLLLILAIAAVLALILAAVQFLPALELTGLSNRASGFSGRAAMAFSWNPILAARGILPSYDGQVFGEYVAYIGVVGLALMLWGGAARDKRRWRWIVLAAVGIFLALGLYNPIYWRLAELPGFNLFRVPARWLALFALGGAMLAGLGAEAFWGKFADSRRANERTTGDKTDGRIVGDKTDGRTPHWASLQIPPLLPERKAHGLSSILYANRNLVITGLFLILLMLATLFSDRAAAEIDGAARPTLTTWAAWAAALVLMANLALSAGRIPRWALVSLTVLLVGGELAWAARNMPINDLVDPSAAFDPRGTALYLREAGITGRTLSISPAYFDTYDKDGLTRRYAQLGMSERAIKAGLTAAKLREIAAPNLSALDGVQSVDGFGGGVLPTVYWSAFSALLQPENALRSIDGRLREYLAQPDCLWACIPDSRVLWLADVEALITDKTADRFYDDIQFDVSLPVTLAAGGFTSADLTPEFTATHVHILTAGDSSGLTLTAGGSSGKFISTREVEDGLTLTVFSLPDPIWVDNVTVTAAAPLTLRAVTAVDARTDDFVQVALGGWDRVLSSDIKLYRADAAPGRAFIPRRVTLMSDDWDGSEAAIVAIRDGAFDPSAEAILHIPPGEASPVLPDVEVSGGAVIISQTDRRVELAVNAGSGGLLVLKDSYFPGWTATVDGGTVQVYRANINQRAVILPQGAERVTFEYAPPWLRPVIALGVAAWTLLVIGAAAVWSLTGRQ